MYLIWYTRVSTILSASLLIWLLTTRRNIFKHLICTSCTPIDAVGCTGATDIAVRTDRPYVNSCPQWIQLDADMCVWRVMFTRPPVRCGCLLADIFTFLITFYRIVTFSTENFPHFEVIKFMKGLTWCWVDWRKIASARFDCAVKSIQMGHFWTSGLRFFQNKYNRYGYVRIPENIYSFGLFIWYDMNIRE